MGKYRLHLSHEQLLILCSVDLGGSLAVASRGLYATGVSTDLNVTYLNSGGQVGDVLKAVVNCDKCEFQCHNTLRVLLLIQD